MNFPASVLRLIDSKKASKSAGLSSQQTANRAQDPCMDIPDEVLGGGWQLFAPPKSLVSSWFHSIAKRWPHLSFAADKQSVQDGHYFSFVLPVKIAVHARCMRAILPAPTCRIYPWLAKQATSCVQCGHVCLAGSLVYFSTAPAEVQLVVTWQNRPTKLPRPSCISFLGQNGGGACQG